jgi:uncharacterized protein YkwD
MGARLVVRGAGRGRAEISLSRGRVTIGSTSDNGVVLADKTVSRQHAILEITKDSCTVADAGSTNGTFVNAQRITAATPVHNGDELRFGALKFFFQAEGASAVGAGPVAPERSWLRHSVVMILALFASAMVVALFVINFSRLITTGLEGSKAPANPTAASAPASAVASPASEDTRPQPWLDALNRYRAMAGLAAVRSNPRLSPGAKLHSRYIATNFSDQIRHSVNLGRAMHQEDPSKPGFTAAGAAAGLAGDVDEMWDPGAMHQSSWAIDNWMLAPFHRLSLLDSRLRTVGYGDYCEAGVCIATLNVHDGVDPSSTSGSSTAPVEYPPNGSSIKGADFTAEWPDPLTSCAGYAPPAGLPITLQLGPLVTPIITSYSLTLNSDPPAAVEACGIDANTYVNPDPATQTLGRELLRTYGAVIIVPRKSLAPGGYTITLNASGQDYTWSFTVNP